MRSSAFCLSHPWLISLVILLPVLTWSQIPTGYYELAEGLDGAELKAALHAIVSDHIQYPYTATSTDVWDILKDSDEDPDNSENVILLYTGRSQAKTLNSGEAPANGSNRWNREHVWSKSHGFPSENDTAYTDCHHLRPADESVNSSRSNKDFDNGGTQHAEATECYSDADSWEPRDAVKGDVARMMFYMVVRYDPGYHTDNMVYDLELIDFTGLDIGDPPGAPLFGKLSTLLQWNAQDPVDAFELQRNEVVFGYQGNRNPFIDHPEWANSIFTSQLAPHTRVGFTGSSLAVDEDAGSVILELSIINPDPSLATQCEINLSGGSGDATDLNGFEAASLTFPPGSLALQSVEIQITDDDFAEEQEVFIFTISNVSGGDSASVNGNDSFILVINPNDQESAVSGLIISEVMDGNRSGGQPKFIEITNTSSETIDISGFQIWRGSNGGEPSLVVTIPDATALNEAASWVIAASSTDMASAGFSTPNQTSWTINGNGNDVYQLRTASAENIDVFGSVGTATAWYENSFAERIASVTNGQASYDSGEWSIQSLDTGLPDNGAPGTPGSHIFEPVVAVDLSLPTASLLMRAYPNPFNPETTVSFTIGGQMVGSASLQVFDITGRLVETLLQDVTEPGSYSITWNAENTASGVYFIRLAFGADVLIQRVTLLR